MRSWHANFWTQVQARFRSWYLAWIRWPHTSLPSFIWNNNLVQDLPHPHHPSTNVTFSFCAVRNKRQVSLKTNLCFLCKLQKFSSSLHLRQKFMWYNMIVSECRASAAHMDLLVPSCWRLQPPDRTECQWRWQLQMILYTEEQQSKGGIPMHFFLSCSVSSLSLFALPLSMLVWHCRSACHWECLTSIHPLTPTDPVNHKLISLTGALTIPVTLPAFILDLSFRQCLYEWGRNVLSIFIPMLEQVVHSLQV